MSERTTTHATFVIERIYPASPSRVFQAWADPAAKSRWFACHDDWKADFHELDFRVGGSERLSTTPPGGEPHRFDARYHDVVPDERIIYSYAMHIGEKRISVSLATVQFEPAGDGTRLIFTEQGAFLDGFDDVSDREAGTRAGLDNLEKVMREELVASVH